METINEIWKPVFLVEFKHLYEVSNKGNIRRRDGKKKLYGHINRLGYHEVKFYNKGHKSFLVHRLVKITFDYREDYSNYHVHHRSPDKTNNAYYNLQYLTPQEHNELERKKGTNKVGVMGRKSLKFKGLIGKFDKEGYLLNFYEGMFDLTSNGYKSKMVYRCVNKRSKIYANHIWRRFPKNHKPEIGKLYDTNDPMFDKTIAKVKKEKKKEYQMALKF
jgi:hypothetical protein